MKLAIAFAAALVLAASGVSAQETMTELRTVPSVDLKRYSGKWYEIARYPNRFQKQCVGNTTATYTQKSNGRIEVLNECLKKDGRLNRAKGDAKIVDKQTNAKLEVRFAPAFLSFIPAVWGDYWIIDLDPEYRFAVVGHPDRKYLWILCRARTLDPAVYSGILERLTAQGYDIDRLQTTLQPPEAATP